MVTVNLFLAELTGNKVRNLIDRSRAVQSVHSDQIANTGRFQFAQVLLHTRRFKLEHRRRHALTQKLKGFLVIGRNLVHIEFHATRFFGKVHRILNDGQVDKTEEVHFKQADRFGIMLVVHHDRRIRRSGSVQRGQVINRGRCNHDTAGMHARLTRQIFQTFCNIPQFLVGFSAVDKSLERCGVIIRSNGSAFLGFSRPRFIQAKVQNSLREEFDDSIRFAVVNAQHAGDVFDHRFGLEHAIRNNLAYAIRTVFLRHVIDHSTAVTVRNIRIDIRHGHAFRIQESFKEKAELKRVNVRDTDDVRDNGTCSRSTTRAHRDSMFTGPVDKVPHNQQVAGNVHVADTV